MKQYPYLSADEAARAAGRAAAMAAAAERSGAAAATLCVQYGIEPTAADPQSFEDQIWSAAGGTPTGLPMALPRQRSAAGAVVALVAAVLLVLAATVVSQQHRDLVSERTARVQQTTEAEVSRTAERFVVSYLLGASEISCRMEARVGEDLQRCLYWEGDDGGPVSSVPTATEAFPFEDGWAVLVNFRLSGKTDAERLLAGQAVYIVPGSDGGWEVLRDRACCRVVNQQSISQALYEATRTEYPPI